MSKDEVSRRIVVGALGVGAAAAAVGVMERVRAARTPGPAPAANATGAPAPDADRESETLAVASTLVSPLVAGSRLGRWTVERVLPVEDGAASIVLSDAAGRQFQLDVCARDDSHGERGPGRSEHFEVFLANRGDGATSTHEDHGLAAMALADLIRGNEHRVERTAFQTLRQRVEARRARLHVTRA